MKKIIYFAIAPLVLLSSCSKDRDYNTTAPTASISQAKLFTSSNTTGKVSYLDLVAAGATVKSFTINSLDSDGVLYNNATDEVVVASRSNNKLEVYSNVTAAANSNATSLMMSAASTSDFSNARETAVSGDKIIVAQDQSAANGNTNKFVVYQKFASGVVSFSASYTLNFKVWAMQMVGNTLYAVADLTGDLLVFDNFLSNPSGSIMPTKRVTIQGLIRTHGLTFSEIDNRMILTDVGSATIDSDGGVIVINNFTSVISSTPNLGTVATSSQVRIYGPNSTLGNPVDVAYDSNSKKIYVAERLNAGGRVLTFPVPVSSSDMAPEAARAEPGVSSIFLFRN